MLKRKAYRELEEWMASSTQKAMLITGARQVGKTFIARQFARDNYESLVELNLLEQPDAQALFASPRKARDLLGRMSLVADRPMVPGHTLVFIDEVQACPEAMTAIKFLVDEGSYDYILSGSLLGTELRDVRSLPVGYVRELQMYPLDFEEFCWSQGVGDDILSMVADSFAGETPVDSFVHERLLDLFYKYLVVGGMPDAVSRYRDSGNLAEVRRVQSDIASFYKRDISQYCLEADKLHVREVFDLIPSELSNPNKRFILKRLNENARFRDLSEAFVWLEHAGVALPAFNVDEPTSPLLASKQRNLFKLFLSDVGLLTGSYSTAAALALLDGGQGVNCGAVFENAVAQELVAHGFSLYYLNSKKHGELDFVVEDRDGRVIPIEVKSGKDYTRHRALSNIMDVPNYGLSDALVLGPCNVERRGRILYAPIYMASCVRNE